QTLQVKAGQVVTLKLHAKAATPPGFTPPKRLGNDTPAHRAMAQLKRGVNLGNGWEAPPNNSWGVHFTTEDIDRIAAEGFDHIRVPVAWHFYLKPGTNGLDISPSLLAELEPVLRRALDKKLHVMLDWHHFDDLTTAPEDHAGRFIGGWEAIARHFQAWPPGLFHELLNEPNAALTTETANPIYQKAITAIRAIDPNRILVVSPGNWGQAGELDKPYQIPASLCDNSGLRSFIDGYNTLPGEQNPCSARVIRETLDAARAWSLHFGRPIHLGEFGCHFPADHASRARYLRDVRTLAEARNIPWTLWEWKAGFGYWNTPNNQPRFRNSLFE
ncbi:MAG: cellulase family glycosylhydrolase, partial [Verrucomicrobia bacterium]|nr:cellulase family glycosylhydrolase [Verrucomicrobiota bacterium]